MACKNIYKPSFLVQIQYFQGDGTVAVDTFIDQVDELSRFYHWDEQKTNYQIHGHIRGTMLAYVRHAPSPLHKWEELKALFMKHFQIQDLIATYKAQFRSHCKRQIEDIYTYVEALQRLLDPAWPFLDCHAKGEMDADQFLLGMSNHGLSLQVAAHEHRRVEDICRVAQPLEAVQDEERFHSR